MAEACQIAARTAVTTDTGLRLQKLASAAFRLGLPADYDVATTRKAIASEIAAIEPAAA